MTNSRDLKTILIEMMRAIPPEYQESNLFYELLRAYRSVVHVPVELQGIWWFVEMSLQQHMPEFPASEAPYWAVYMWALYHGDWNTALEMHSIESIDELVSSTWKTSYSKIPVSNMVSQDIIEDISHE